MKRILFSLIALFGIVACTPEEPNTISETLKLTVDKSAIEANGTDEEQQKCQKRRFYIDNLKLHSEPMSGIGNVTVEDESAPVEYYNLQGVRLEQPAKGLVIRKQGKRSTTVYFK